MRECPICKSNDLKILLKRTDSPIKQNEPISSREQAKKVEKADLSIHICGNCTFVFNSTFRPELIVYNENYNNNQSHSDFFSDYTYQIAKSMLSEHNIRNNKVLEIGCGKGDFLKMLISLDKSNQGYGFDTTYEGEKTLGGNLTFYKDYFGEEYSGFETDVVISRHVIEHISNPNGFLEDIKKSLNNNKLKVFFETPSIEWILENNAFWDFFYEHCSYFSTYSADYLFKQIGWPISKIDRIFGGQYLWIESVPFISSIGVSNKEDILNLCENFKKSYEKKMDYWLSFVKINSKLAIWGAGAKGVTFLNLVDKDAINIKYVIDINPDKQEKYIPGTGHKIVSPESINALDLDGIIVMNSNYYSEIEKVVSNKKIKLYVLE